MESRDQILPGPSLAQLLYQKALGSRLSKTILTVRGEITKGDGTKLTGGGQTDVAPVNNFLHSLFKQVDVYLNGKQVTPAMGTYPYRAYIETLLNYDASAKESQFTSALYYKRYSNKDG